MYATETIRALEREARETARLARAVQVDVQNALALVTCIGCSHPKHVALRCHETTAITHQPCDCDLHFGLWPDDESYPQYLTNREQFEHGFLDIPGMGRHSLAEIDSWQPTVRRIAADGLRSLYENDSL